MFSNKPLKKKAKKRKEFDYKIHYACSAIKRISFSNLFLKNLCYKDFRLQDRALFFLFFFLKSFFFNSNFFFLKNNNYVKHPWLTIGPHIPYRKSFFVRLRLAWRAAMNELQSLCLGGHIMNISPQSLTPPPNAFIKGLIFRNQHDLKMWFMWFNPSRHNKKKRLEISSSTWKAHFDQNPKLDAFPSQKYSCQGFILCRSIEVLAFHVQIILLLRASILICIDIFRG